jgi:uncharacterized protein involved in outer membrane biogenesis
VKKLFVGLGIFLALIVAAMAIIPSFVDVDKYRPQVIAAVNQEINGKLELGRLSLSLWGRVKVEIGGVKLLNPEGTAVVSVSDAYVDIPLVSLLTGSPELNLNMENPDILVIKDKAGKLNVTSLMKIQTVKTQATQTSSTAQATPTKAASSNEPVKIPGIVANSRIGIVLQNATVTYQDEKTGLSSILKNLNFVAKDLSLSHPSEIELWSELDTKMGKTLTVKGPARFTGNFNPTVAGGKLDHFTLNANADLDALEIAVPGTFEKKKGVPAHAVISVSGSEKDVHIEAINVKFFNAEITSSGTISDLDAPSGGTIQYQVKSNEIELRSWNELVPMLKDYELGGTANFSATISGALNKIGYQAKLGVNGLTAKAPELKAEPRIDGSVVITTDQIQSLLFTMKAPGNELTIKGKVLSFTAPQVSMEVTSNGMDVDQLMDLSAPATQKSEAAPAEKADATAGKTPSGDMDAMLNPLRENPVALKTVANIGFDFKTLQVKGAKITNLKGKLTMRDLSVALDGFSMEMFDGSVKASMAAQLKPKEPAYHFTAQVAGMDLSEAMQSQMTSFKNTLQGKLALEAAGEGSSFNVAPAEEHLKAKGSFKIQNAVFNSLDVGKMVSGALTDSLGKIAGKIPGLSGKQLPGLPNKAMKYDLVSSDFGISNGVFTAPNFNAKAAANQGIDFKGSTQVGLKDHALKADWEIIDTYDLTKAKELSVNEGGIQINHVLAEGNGPVQFPVSVGCTLAQPCFAYKDVSDYLAKVALSNVGSQAKSQVIQKALGNTKLPDAVKNKLKGLFGG